MIGFDPEGEAIQPVKGDAHTRALWLSELTSACAPWPWLFSVRVTEGAIPRQPRGPLKRTWGVGSRGPDGPSAQACAVPFKADLILRTSPFGEVERVSAGFLLSTREGDRMVFPNASAMFAWVRQQYDAR